MKNHITTFRKKTAFEVTFGCVKSSISAKELVANNIKFAFESPNRLLNRDFWSKKKDEITTLCT